VVQPAVVAVGHSHQLHARHLDRVLRIALPLAARANQRHLNMIVRRNWRDLENFENRNSTIYKRGESFRCAHPVN
jgi:hypothetical protein